MIIFFNDLGTYVSNIIQNHLAPNIPAWQPALASCKPSLLPSVRSCMGELCWAGSTQSCTLITGPIKVSYKL